MGQGTDGDDIHPAPGHRRHRLKGNTARGLYQGPVVYETDRLLHGSGVHIVKHDDIDTAGQALAYLLQGLGLNLNTQGMGNLPAQQGHGPGNRSAGLDMIILDQDTVGQAETMVITAADLHRVFFQEAQAGGGLAGIGDPHRTRLHLFDKAGGEGGNAGEALQEIERQPLGLQEIDNRTCHSEQEITRLNPGTIGHQICDHDGWILYPKDLGGHRFTAGHDKRLSGHNSGAAHLVGPEDRLRSQIAAPDILGQKGADQGMEGRLIQDQPTAVQLR